MTVDRRRKIEWLCLEVLARDADSRAAFLDEACAGDVESRTRVRCHDVAPDGQRIYVVQSVTPPPPQVGTHSNLIQNRFEELKAKVPRQ